MYRELLLIVCITSCQRGRSRGAGGGNGPPTFIVMGAEPPHFSSMHTYSHTRSTQLRAHWIYFLLCMGEFAPSLYLLLLPLCMYTVIGFLFCIEPFSAKLPVKLFKVWKMICAYIHVWEGCVLLLSIKNV